VTDTVSFTVHPDQPIGTIAPALHGQFAEHLGELVYPGVWVGEDSPVPNVGGIRSDVVDALRPLAIPVLRWPGGCFADDYHWRDGIGPRHERPSRLNVHWGMAPEPNQFGTHEFMAFTRAIGAEPYFAGNLGSGTPQELRDWIEYCNHQGGTTLSDERIGNGAGEPFGIRYWGIGNENWGCGGRISPQEYAEQYSRFRTFAFPFGGNPVYAIAAGANGNDWEWTRSFLGQLQSSSLGSGNRLATVQAMAAHYYCGTAGTATDFSEEQWYELLAKAAAIEGIVTGHRQLMDVVDPERSIGLIVDEWGTWHPVEEGKPRGGLYQQNTMRDALVAALSLDVFHNHAEKLVMANIAQLINVLQSLLLVDESRCITTPTYHVFALYAAHRGGQAVTVRTDAEVISDGGQAADQCDSCYLDGSAPGLRRVTGSASLHDDRVVVTMVNASAHAPVDVVLDLGGVDVSTLTSTTLGADDIHAHNTFEAPDTVKPQGEQVLQSARGTATVVLPPASVTRLVAVRQT
jgi:alpha-L-arabinofuranosidase